MENTLSGYLSDLYEDGGKRLGRSMSLWRDGVHSEVSFWSNWFATEGREWPDDYTARLRPRPLVQWLQDLLPEQTGQQLRILDVGAGPITMAGTFVPDRSAEILAVDPLAHFYASIISENQAEVPLSTELAFAEDLSCRYEPSSFDIVNCQNALDHSIEPMSGVIEMFTVLKLNGAIFLGHRQNEAEFEN